MFIEKDDSVLDFCCGDGSYAYLFFSDIARKVVAIDYDKNIIKYAKKRYYRDNIHYICADLLKFEVEKNAYDIVIWSAGVAYFTKDDRKIIFDKISNTLKKNGKIFITTPLEQTDSFGANQKKVITNIDEFENEFKTLFKIIFYKQTQHIIRNNLNYILEKK